MLNIYKLYDEEYNLLYIGKTKNINNRIGQHISDRNKIAWKGKISKIMIADLDSELDLEMYETYYINKLNPPYNTSKVYNCESRLELIDLEFYEYNRKTPIKDFYKLDNKNVGLCYKIYFFKGFCSFSISEISKKFNIPISTLHRNINECIEINLIDKLSDSKYKVSSNFI